MAPTAKVEPVIKKAKQANPMKFQRKNIIRISTSKLLGLKPGVKKNEQDCQPIYNTTEHPSSYFPKTLPCENFEPIKNNLQRSEYRNENQNTLNIVKNRNRLAVLNDGAGVRKIVIVPQGSLYKIRPSTPERSVAPPPERTQTPPKDSFFDGFLESLPKESLEHNEQRGIPIAKKFVPFLRKGLSAICSSATKILTEIEKDDSGQKMENSNELLIRRFETLMALFNRIELELQNHAQYIHHAQIMQSFLTDSDEKAFDIFQNHTLSSASTQNNKILGRAQEVADCIKQIQKTINDAAIFARTQSWYSGNDSTLCTTPGDISI